MIRVTPTDVGARVSLRYRLPPPVAPGDPTLTDVVGELVAFDDLVLTVRTRAGGVVEVPARSVVASKVVPG